MCRSVFSNVGFLRREPGGLAQKVQETGSVKRRFCILIKSYNK